MTADAVDGRMAGPAIRAWHMADELSAEHEVQLVSTVSAERRSGRFVVASHDQDSIGRVASWAEVVVLHPAILRTHPTIDDGATPIVVDVYDPFHLENLEDARPGAHSLEHRAENVLHLNGVINDALRRGDFFLSASEKQRDFWLGSLTALGRVNPLTYDADPTMFDLVGIAPFGISTAPPRKRRTVLRGVVPGIGAEDRLLLWGGGVYDWFDPVTLIEAVAQAAAQLDDLRLVFLGMTHPNPDLPPMRAAADARRRSGELGLTGRHVFFNDGWIPYDERADYLLEADIGVSTHRQNLETAFSFRTRMLDYLWAGLPIITSDGDGFANLTLAKDLGAVTPPGDAGALAAAIEDLLTTPGRLATCAANSSEVARTFHWSKVLEPLTRFAADPALAPDRRHAPSPVTTADADPPASSGTSRDVLRRARRRLGR